jgi:hypothetical protein
VVAEALNDVMGRMLTTVTTKTQVRLLPGGAFWAARAAVLDCDPVGRWPGVCGLDVQEDRGEAALAHAAHGGEALLQPRQCRGALRAVPTERAISQAAFRRLLLTRLARWVVIIQERITGFEEIVGRELEGRLANLEHITDTLNGRLQRQAARASDHQPPSPTFRDTCD